MFVLSPALLVILMKDPLLWSLERDPVLPKPQVMIIRTAPDFKREAEAILGLPRKQLYIN